MKTTLSTILLITLISCSKSKTCWRCDVYEYGSTDRIIYHIDTCNISTQQLNLHPKDDAGHDLPMACNSLP